MDLYTERFACDLNFRLILYHRIPDDKTASGRVASNESL